MTPLELIRVEIDRLREDRRRRGRDPLADRPFIERIDAMFDGLSDDDYAVVNGEGWRGWPDLYDARMAQ